MKKIIHKAFWNYEKEEQWLNGLAVRGLALTDYSWMRYVFEETEPGKYIYQVELLEKSPQNPESELYLRFLEDAGVEVVASYMKWVYLRKEAADGPFAVYSDNDSKIRYLKRVRCFWTGLLVLEFTAGLLNLGICFFDLINAEMQALHYFPWINFIGGAICTGIGIVFFFTLFLPVHLQIRKIMKDKTLHE